MSNTHREIGRKRLLTPATQLKEAKFSFWFFFEIDSLSVFAIANLESVLEDCYRTLAQIVDLLMEWSKHLKKSATDYICLMLDEVIDKCRRKDNDTPIDEDEIVLVCSECQQSNAGHQTKNHSLNDSSIKLLFHKSIIACLHCHHLLSSPKNQIV